MPDIIYPAGIKFFKTGAKQPDWIIGNFVITPDDLMAWVIDHPSLLTEYNGKKQLKLDLRKGKDGPYVAVNTWKAGGDTAPAASVAPVANPGRSDIAEPEQSDLPF